MDDIKYFDSFITNDVEYPSNEMLLNGLKDGDCITYVSSTYLNGLINYVDIIDAWMIKRYLKSKNDIEYVATKDQKSWEESCEYVDELTDDPLHFHFKHSSSNFDDMIILAKGADSYWLFWDDCDCSDCSIMRISIKTFESDEEAKKSVMQYAKEVSDENIIHHIRPGLFRGWITL